MGVLVAAVVVLAALATLARPTVAGPAKEFTTKLPTPEDVDQGAPQMPLVLPLPNFGDSQQAEDQDAEDADAADMRSTLPFILNSSPISKKERVRQATSLLPPDVGDPSGGLRTAGTVIRGVPEAEPPEDPRKTMPSVDNLNSPHAKELRTTPPISDVPLPGAEKDVRKSTIVGDAVPQPSGEDNLRTKTPPSIPDLSGVDKSEQDELRNAGPGLPSGTSPASEDEHRKSIPGSPPGAPVTEPTPRKGVPKKVPEDVPLITPLRKGRKAAMPGIPSIKPPDPDEGVYKEKPLRKSTLPAIFSASGHCVDVRLPDILLSNFFRSDGHASLVEDETTMDHVLTLDTQKNRYCPPTIPEDQDRVGCHYKCNKKHWWHLSRFVRSDHADFDKAIVSVYHGETMYKRHKKDFTVQSTVDAFTSWCVHQEMQYGLGESWTDLTEHGNPCILRGCASTKSPTFWALKRETAHACQAMYPEDTCTRMLATESLDIQDDKYCRKHKCLPPKNLGNWKFPESCEEVYRDHVGLGRMEFDQTQPTCELECNYDGEHRTVTSTCSLTPEDPEAPNDDVRNYRWWPLREDLEFRFSDPDVDCGPRPPSCTGPTGTHQVWRIKGEPRPYDCVEQVEKNGRSAVWNVDAPPVCDMECETEEGEILPLQVQCKETSKDKYEWKWPTDKCKKKKYCELETPEVPYWKIVTKGGCPRVTLENPLSPPTCEMKCVDSKFGAFLKIHKVVPCKPVGDKLLYQYPSQKECGPYCEGPFSEPEYLRLVAQHTEDEHVRDAIQALGNELDAMTWMTNPLETGLRDDWDVSRAHGGPRMVWYEQPFVEPTNREARELDVRETTSLPLAEAYLNAEGCPHGADIMREDMDPERIHEYEKKLPVCRIACSKHKPEPHARAIDPWIMAIDFGASQGKWHDLQCKFDLKLKRFIYPPPENPKCIVTSCWGYEGAFGEINGKVIWYEEGVNAPDIVMKTRPPCPPSVPDIRPKTFNVTRVRDPLPRLVPTPPSLQRLRPDRERPRDLFKRKLLLSPWPAEKLVWSYDIVTPPAPFPVVKGQCESLNRNTELTQNGRITFRDNPNPDPSKLPWQPGGECYPLAGTRIEEGTPTPTPTPTKEIFGFVPTTELTKLPPATFKERTGCKGPVVGGVYFDGTPAFGIYGGALQMRVGESVQYLNAMNPADVLRHLRVATDPYSTWGDAFRGGFICSEEMSTTPSLGTLGGDLAEFIMALGTWERVGTKMPVNVSPHTTEAKAGDISASVFLELGGIDDEDQRPLEDVPWLVDEDDSIIAARPLLEMTDVDVFNALVDWLTMSGVKLFRWCTDHAALQELCKATQWCPMDIRSLLNPPPHVVPSLLDLMEHEDFVGSQHIRGMLLHPDKYDVRPDLVKASLRAVYALLWQIPLVTGADEALLGAARAKLQPGISPSAFRAGAIVEVRGGGCPSSLYPLIAGQAEYGSQVMVVHTDALQVFRLELASFVVSRMGASQADIVQVHSQLSLAASAAHTTTIDLYSYGLPTFCVAYETPNQQPCAFRPPFLGVPDRLPSTPYSAVSALLVSPDPNGPTDVLEFDAMTKTQIEDFVRMQASRWVPVLLQGFGAADGRQREAVLAAPGADIGQWILALAAYERGSMTELGQKEVEALFVHELRSSVRPVFTLYLDVDALGELCRIGRFCPPFDSVNDDPEQRANAVLRHLMVLSPAQGSKLLESMGTSEHVVDRFVRMLVQGDLHEAHVRGALAQFAVRAYFAVLWNASPTPLDAAEHNQLRAKLDVVVLQGEARRERAIVSVFSAPDAPLNQAPVLQPDYADTRVVFVHEDASRTLRQHFLQVILAHSDAKEVEFAQTRLHADVMAAQAVQALLDTEHPTLPRYQLHLG